MRSAPAACSACRCWAEATTAAKRPEAVAAQAQKARYSEGASLKPLAADRDQSGEPQGHVDPDRGIGRLRRRRVGRSNALAAAIAEDIVAYLRTVPLAQLEGPSGFLHLREDLNDRARIRSGGKVARAGHPGAGARMIRLVGALLLVLLATSQAAAQVPSLESLIPAGDATAAGRIIQLILVITVLSVAPGLLIMVTCFTRFVVALSFLRAGLGLQTTPANLILISLALFMTFYVMGPTFDKAWQGGVQPLMENKISEKEAYTRISAPFRAFMRANVRDKDLKLFADLANESLQVRQEDPEIDLRVLIPAFMISELRRGFEIGFLIVLPFLVIDMIVATLTMSMGMMMLPPTVISLPFKILFFVLIDGWNLLVGGLLRSFA